MAPLAAVPGPVLAAYGWDGLDSEPLGSGLINDTFVVRRPGEPEPVAVVQRLHPVFSGEVNRDLDAVTRHLQARGVPTPRLIRSADDALWVEHDGRPWRAISYLPGRTVDRVGDPALAEAAGALVGRFHRALGDFEHDYVHVRAGVHDTAAHLDGLRDQRGRSTGDAAADRMADQVLEAASRLPELGDLPRRHCHGDLKISNVLFERGENRALALIDLDTCGLQTIAYELGDALRSWCNPAGEDDGVPALDLEILERAMRGYAGGAADLLKGEEIAAIVPGLHTICVELAARFATDVYRDCYFGWDPQRFASRREHNRARARGQLALASSVERSSDRAREVVARAFGR